MYNFRFYRGLFYNAGLHMVALLLPFWKKFCFILSAKNSTKCHMQTMSGQAISDDSLDHCTITEEDSEDKHFDKLGKIIQGRVEERSVKDDTIRGIRVRVAQQDKALGRRDAFQTADRAEAGFENLVCQFCLSTGICHVKHESGLEVPMPCETFVTPHYERVCHHFSYYIRE